MNLLQKLVIPSRDLISAIFVGTCNWLIDLSFSGSGEILSAESIWPLNIILVTANLYLLGFIFKPLSRVRWSSVLRFLLCSSNLFPQIRISSLMFLAFGHLLLFLFMSGNFQRRCIYNKLIFYTDKVPDEWQRWW